MKIRLQNGRKGENGSIVAYFIFVVILITGIASLATYVTQTTNLTQRRGDMIGSREIAMGGAVVGAANLNRAVTNTTGTFISNITSQGYAKNNSLSTAQSNVYVRTISAPFSNQTSAVQIWMTNTASPLAARILASATVGKVTQSAAVNVKIGWSRPAAIISTHPGTSSGGASKSTAQAGNVVILGAISAITLVDGDVIANGRVNIDNKAWVPPASVSMTNRNTANQIPDYTSQGSSNRLFDFARLKAIARATPNALNTYNTNNYFTNLNSFITANNAAFLTPAKALEGVIMVEIGNNDNGTGNLTPSNIPNGINVKGTLFFNFGPGYGPLDKVVNTAAVNINPAVMTGFNATNPATFKTGYPPVYYDNTKNPTNRNITGSGFVNVTPTEDLPAMVYSVGIFDVHGPVNISGVCYTPSFFEIENKNSGQIQYFKGTLISGLGCYIDNTGGSRSVVSIDENAIDSLSTIGYAGKQVLIAYWE